MAKEPKKYRKYEAYFRNIPLDLDLSDIETLDKVVFTIRVIYGFSEDSIMKKPFSSLGYWFNKALKPKNRTVAQMYKVNMIWQEKEKSFWSRILKFFTRK